MNKRIKELEKLSIEKVNCGLNGTSTAERFNREKFAKLIIKECADWVECAQNEGGDRISDSFYWSAIMKKHFGVES